MTDDPEDVPRTKECQTIAEDLRRCQTQLIRCSERIIELRQKIDAFQDEINRGAREKNLKKKAEHP